MRRGQRGPQPPPSGQSTDDYARARKTSPFGSVAPARTDTGASTAIAARNYGPTTRGSTSAYNKAMPRQMTSDEVRAFLGHGTRTLRLATVSADGQPHVMPVWFVLDGDEIVFRHGPRHGQGTHLRRDPRVALLVDDDTPPFAFVHVRGRVTLSEDLDELLRVATEIGARYMGADRAEEFGRRNGVPGELRRARDSRARDRRDRRRGLLSGPRTAGRRRGFRRRIACATSDEDVDHRLRRGRDARGRTSSRRRPCARGSRGASSRTTIPG